MYSYDALKMFPNVRRLGHMARCVGVLLGLLSDIGADQRLGNSAEYAELAYLPGSVTPLAPLAAWASSLTAKIIAPAGQASWFDCSWRE